MLCLPFFIAAQSAGFNQNASRSNHSGIVNKWQFDLGTGARFSVKSNESRLFSGNGFATRIAGRYQFGLMGLGFSGGLVPGSLSQSGIAKFLTDRKIQQAESIITQSRPSNAYFLAGPSFQAGNRVLLTAQVQAGFFVNDAGSFSITPNGAQKPIYQFENGSNKIKPGFSGSLQLAYPLTKSTRLFLSTDYFYSNTSIRLIDQQSGIDQSSLSRSLQFFTTGIGITKSFSATPNRTANSRETGSGIATGRRSSRDASSGLATGRRSTRMAAPGNGRIIAASSSVQAPKDRQTGLATGKRNAAQPPAATCGPVTERVTQPNGVITERQFACPDDALYYKEQQVTARQQSPDKGANEETYAAMPATGNRFIAGRLSWHSREGNNHILTNRSVAAEKTALGIAAQFYSREAGSGIATGRRSAREKGSGLATGRRQYQPILISAGTSDQSNQGRLVTISNPLFEANTNNGQNPIHESNQAGTAGTTVYLVSAFDGNVIATTQTNSDGSFWFAHVPDIPFKIRISGSVKISKQYQLTIASTTGLDIAGEWTNTGDQWTLELAQDSTAANANSASFGQLSLSLLNQKEKVQVKSLPIALADIDADGQSEFLVGGNLPGSTVISSTLAVGSPIAGMEITASNNGNFNPDWQRLTNNYGEFELTGLNAGTYLIRASQWITIEAETWLPSNSSTRRADHNSSRSNKSAAQQDEEEQPVQKARNNNTVRSNRGEYVSVLIEADTDADGSYETNISSSHAFILEELATGNSQTRMASGVNTSRSNIRNQARLEPLAQGLFLLKATALVNGKEVPVQAILKTRHETVKNSISNIR